MASEETYTLRHFRRMGPALLASLDWHSFQAANDRHAIHEAQNFVAGRFDPHTDYVPLWRGTHLIWEEGGRA